MATPYMQRRLPWKPMLLAIAVVLGLSWASSLIVTAHMPWYDSLQKPVFNPPSWSFGVVWPTLYIMMILAAALVWNQPARLKQQETRLRGLFILQLVLNLLWTPVFFGLESPDLGLLWLALVWLAAFATLVHFWRAHLSAGLLMVPYQLWLSFAAVLNYSILVLN